MCTVKVGCWIGVVMRPNINVCVWIVCEGGPGYCESDVGIDNGCSYINL
jgi:hypothetical protein